MLHFVLPIVALALAQGDQLEIANPRGTYGHLGALRTPKTGILPGDVLHFAFDIKNLKTDAQGRALYSIGMEVLDDRGEVFYRQAPYNSVALNLFGGNSLPVSASMDIPLNARPGTYHWKITLEDRTTKQTLVQKGKGMVLKPEFGLVRVGTFADAEGKVPVPPVGVVGSSLFVHFAVVGFARNGKKQPDLATELRILDEAGKPTVAQPLAGRVHEDVPDDMRILPMQFGLTLNRPGNFTIELTGRCQLSGKSAQIRLPVRVLPLE